MIYLDNTTDNQTIFIDREMQSIENIKSITLDSNYYTKTEIDTEFLKVNTEIETINEDIDVLNERITDIENNGDFLVISPVELGLNEYNVFKSPYTIGEWRNILNSNKTIILKMPIQANSLDNVEDSEVNYCERYVVGSNNLSGVEIIFKWYTLYFPLNTNEDFIPNIKLFKRDTSSYDNLIDDLDERVTTLDENVTSLDNRVTTLENNDDFLVISPVELGINENNVFKSPYTIGEWKNILNSNKTIILRMPIQANSMDNVEDSEVNYCERYIIGSDIFTGIQIIFKWYTLYFLGDSDDNYIPNIRLYKTEPLRYDALIDDLDERVTNIEENVTSLDERVTTLENNGANYYTKDEVNVIKTNIEYSIEDVKLKATPYTIRDDVDEILNLIRNGDGTSNPFLVLGKRNVLIRLKEDPNDWDIVCNVTSWFYNFRKGWFIFSYYSDVDKELKTIKYTYDENNIANELKREIL